MKKIKAASKDFDVNGLPHNRKEVFFDVLKLHWRKLLFISLLVFLAFLPFVAVAFLRDNYGLGLTIKVNEGSITPEQRLYSLKIAYLISAGAMWLSLYFAFIFIGPIFRIIRQMVWGEPIFLKEDFVKGLKENYKNGAVVATISGLMIVVHRLVLLMGDNAIFQSIPLALFLAFIAPAMAMAYIMGTLYAGKYFQLLKTSFLLYVKDALVVLGATLLLLCPFALAYISSAFIVKYILVIAVLIFVIPLTCIIYTLICHSIFDKFINKEQYPSIYKKGIYPINENENTSKSKELPLPTFYWAKQKKKNQVICFALDLDIEEGYLRVCAADTYQVFLDGKLVSYGPSRTAAFYSVPRIIKFKGSKRVEIKVLSFGVGTYEVDGQDPYFACQVFSINDNLIHDSGDFSCFIDLGREEDNPKYSFQRGFIERYDFSKSAKLEIEKKLLLPPTLLSPRSDHASYKEKELIFTGIKEFTGFSSICKKWWDEQISKEYDENVFDLNKGFFAPIKDGCYSHQYELKELSTGFIKVKIACQNDVDVFICFDEILVNGEISYARSANNDLIVLHLQKGENSYLTQEPYAFKYLRILSKEKLDVKISIIALENKDADFIKYEGDKQIKEIFDAAKATYRQAALDIFMDCPGRERAGWLCDSYFTGMAEELFSGRNDIEKDFLENFLIASTSEIEEKMVPMCFPSTHSHHRYIPNWSMFFLLELASYYKRTGDEQLIAKAKSKAYGVVSFFDEYVNESGLLENLDSWIFVEWSICNSQEYVSGVNYPSNMLFSSALKAIAEIYGDQGLLERARLMDEEIVKESFNGEFFIENANRADGKLVLNENHLTETCQYYALFNGLIPNKEFERKMVNEFGPSRTPSSYKEVSRSNVFIGFYLRFIYLNRIGENEKLVEEALPYFHNMAIKTGTLWEHDSPSASCCHGFASSIAVFLAKALTGYKGVKDGKIVFDLNHVYKGKHNFKISHDS